MKHCLDHYMFTHLLVFAYESFEQMIESIIKRQTLMKNKPNNPKIFVIIDSVTYEKQNLIYSPACKYLFENMQDLNIGNIIVIDTKIPDPSFQFDIIKKKENNI